MHRSALICDFDNTLYDWVGYFVPSLYEMIDVVVDDLRCDRESLIEDLRRVHQSHGDAEHPYSILETETVRRAFPDKDRSELAVALDNALHAFNRARKRRLKLYDGVLRTLEALSNAGVRIVGHTESRPLAVRDRLNRLGLSKFFKRVYCRERAASHSDIEINHPDTDLVELSHHQAKPSPSVLLEICDRERLQTATTVYVGDSLFKDVSMANAAGVTAAWARYGAQVVVQDYEKLVAVSHWSEEDVKRARAFAKGAVPARPDIILENGFDELLAVFSSDGEPKRISA